MTSNLSETPNNRQRAAEMINLWELSRRAGRDTPGAMHIVQALEAAGLLTPDLPEIRENSAGEGAIDGDGFYLEISGDEAIINDRIAFNQEHLKDLGLALLAAADHMEKNT